MTTLPLVEAACPASAVRSESSPLTPPDASEVPVES
jgi:hypothetical protein